MRFHDSTWFRASGLKSRMHHVEVGDRVSTDPDSIRREIHATEFMRAYFRLVHGWDGNGEPPSEEDVRIHVESSIRESMDRIYRLHPTLEGKVESEDLFLSGYFTQEQFDTLEESASYWEEVWKDRECAYREWKEVQRGRLPRRLRFLSVHDASVTVERSGDTIEMISKGGLGIPDRIVFRNARVIQGELPSSFGGLYTEVGMLGNRYEVGFLGQIGRDIVEFTLTADDVSLFNFAGTEIGDDYNHDDATFDPTRHGSKVLWIRDEANRTYRRNIEPKERKGPVVFDPDSMTLRIDFNNL